MIKRVRYSGLSLATRVPNQGVSFIFCVLALTKISIDFTGADIGVFKGRGNICLSAHFARHIPSCAEFAHRIAEDDEIRLL